MTLTNLRLLLLALLCGSLLGSAYGQSPAKDQEAKAIAVVQSATADYQAKVDACRELARIGTSAAVPALSALLEDEKLAHMARYGLETLPDPAVDEALRANLGKLHGRLLIGVIGSTGVRHDAKAVPQLLKLVANPDADVAQAAARAVGMIATADATVGLQAALSVAPAANQLAICEGLFRCAEAASAKGNDSKAAAIYDALCNFKAAPHQVLAGAWRGAILSRQQEGLPLLMKAVRSTEPAIATAALRIALEVKAPGVAEALAEELTNAPAARQIQLCKVLGKRAEPAALPALLALAKAGEPAARVAAIQAVAEIGDLKSAAPMIALMIDPEATVAQAATTGLAGLPGPRVDALIVKAAAIAPPNLKLKLLDMLRQRRIVTSMPVVLMAMADNDPAIRAAAAKASAELATANDLPSLLERLLKATEPGEIEALERAVNASCAGAEAHDKCLPKLRDALGMAGPKVKPALLRILLAMGGADALQAVQATVADPDKDVHLAAIRALCDWKTVDAAPVLLELAKSSSAPVDKILSLRGYLGMASRNELQPAERLVICRNAAPLITRSEEKTLLLGALANLANPEALDLVTVHLADQAVSREAVAAVLAIASKRPANQHVAVTRGALEKAAVAAANQPDDLKRVQEALRKMAAEK